MRFLLPLRAPLLIGAAAFCAVIPLSAGSEPPSKPLVITSVTVIDGTGRPPLTHRTVVIDDGRIARIREDTEATPPGVELIDGTGRFLIPGLWNMHVHSVGYEEARKAMPGLLAKGITGVRDMGAPLDGVLRLRREVAAGDLLGPRLVVAGPLLQGRLPPPFSEMPLLRPVADRDDAAAAVRFLREKGVDFIKVGDTLPRNTYFAITAEAKRLGIPVAGHLPPGVKAAEASDAGQRCVEHLGGSDHALLIDCSAREGELRVRVEAILAAAMEGAFQGQEPDDSGLFRAGLTKALVESYDEAKAAALFRRFVRNETWQAPTLVALRGLWDRSDLTEEDVRAGRAVRDEHAKIVGAMARAGVRLLAGSDGPLDGAADRLFDELELLVKAGLTPSDVLQCATRNPAEFLGQDHQLGTVEAGKMADLVLLEADPLEDIRNVRRVAAVVRSGRLVGPAASR